MKRPAFQFYVQDFLMGTIHMTAEEVGGYIRLLCYQWDKGSVPGDEATIMKISGIKKKSISNVLVKFTKKEDGCYMNSKLEKVRLAQEEFVKKQTANGQKGGRPKGTQQEPNPNPSGNPNETSSTSTSTSKEDVDFNDPYFQAMRRAVGRHINDNEIWVEVGKFKNKYPNTHINKAGALINTWAGNIGLFADKKEQSETKEMVM